MGLNIRSLPVRRANLIVTRSSLQQDLCLLATTASSSELANLPSFYFPLFTTQKVIMNFTLGSPFPFPVGAYSHSLASNSDQTISATYFTINYCQCFNVYNTVHRTVQVHPTVTFFTLLS